MKQHGTLNRQLSWTIASMGHTDAIVVADAGLPIPDSTERIDLALREGVPGFLETAKTVLEDLKVERAVVAAETLERSPELHGKLTALLGDIPVDSVSHEELKDRTSSARAVVRTGEFTPFANVILYSGVVF